MQGLPPQIAGSIVMRSRSAVKSDYSQFIDRIREGRETVATEMQRIFEGWKNDKDAFDTVANREMAAYGAAYIHGIADGPQRMLKAMASNDPAAVLDESLHEANVLRRILSGLFEKHGVPEQDQLKKVVEFFRWDGLCELPSNRISGHLYAAVARKAAAGQKKPPTRGLTNDVRVISTYAPYVDAMFIDNECAGLLAEEPLRSRLAFKARIFCLNSKDEFVAYLRSLEQQTDPIVLKRANQLYGV